MLRHRSSTIFKNFKILTWITFVFVSLIYNSHSAKAAIYAGPETGWFVISSHSTQQDAIKNARQYARSFPTILVFSSTNGFFAVSLGWVTKERGKDITRRLKSGGYVPGDSYVSRGQRWVRAVWSANNSHLANRAGFLKASRLIMPGETITNPIPDTGPDPEPYNVTRVSPSPAKVAGLDRSGDNYLSLRLGPGTSFREILRMRSGTRLTITGQSSAWYQVKLDDGRTGFAHSKYVKLAKVPIVGPVTDPDRQAGTSADDNKNAGATIPDQKRVALVLGNSKYENTANLANPKNDADAIGTTLERLGFAVVKGLDLTKVGMELAIRKFVRQLQGADVALFFYAGHAMQVGAKNYLIPTDAALEDSTALEFETIKFNLIIELMNESGRTSIALLDACRNNPLARNFTRKLSKTRAALVGSGLAAPSLAGGQLLIGFATSPNEVALDGETENSPFTAALLRHMETPGLEIELMLKRVKSDVYEETGGNQSPWNNSALRREFYFVK